MKNISNKKLPQTISFLFIFLFGNTFLFSQTTDTLWQKAVAISEKNEHWMPGKILENETVYNLDGGVEETTKREIKLFKNTKGKLDGKLVQTLVNGEDITEQEQKEFEKSDETLGDDDESENPFNPRFQKNISTTRLPGTAMLNGNECTLFRYVQKTDGIELEGKTWLEKTSGIPLKIEFSTDKKIKEEELIIKRLEGTVLYKYDDPDRWYPVEIIHHLDIEMKVYFFYTFEGKVDNKVSLDNYFRI